MITKRRNLNSLLVFTISVVSIAYDGSIECLQYTTKRGVKLTSRSNKKSHNLLHTIADPPSVSCDQKTEILRFGGEIFYSSSPLPNCDSLKGFFSDHNMQKILLSGGTTAEQDPYSVAESSSHRVTSMLFNRDLFEAWKHKSIAVGARVPQENDTIVLVEPKAIEMVGVRILPQTIIGTTVSTHLHQTIGLPSIELEMPEFQAVLIHDDTRAEGPPFLVWLFNKVARDDEQKDELLGNMNEEQLLVNKSSYKRKNHESFLRVWAEPLNLDSNMSDEIVFKSSISMWLELRFPSFFLRFFPIRKSKAEELCSAAIVKSLRTSFFPAFQEFCIAYSQSLCQQQSQ